MAVSPHGINVKIEASETAKWLTLQENH